MAHAQHQIEFNGKLYDAASGNILSEKSDTSPVKQQTTQTLDGFVVRKTIPVKDKPLQHRTHPPSAKTAHSAAQKSKTLMRSAVKKPVTITKPALLHHDHPAIARPALTSPVRLGRAEKIHQSKLISRFGSDHQTVEAQIVPLPVQTAPEIDQDLMNHHTTPVEKTPPAARGNNSIDFEKALHQANSHKQPKTPKSKLAHRVQKRFRASAKIKRLSAVVASVLLLGGFFFYQNLPSLSMRFAAARAGVDARLPGYRPAGFALSNKITYSPGQISVKYKSNSDERSFQLTQKNTNLNSQSFSQQQTANNTQSYQTLESNGKTIYIYAGSNATWISNGTLYQIEGNSALTSEQLLRLAASL